MISLKKKTVHAIILANSLITKILKTKPYISQLFLLF